MDNQKEKSKATGIVAQRNYRLRSGKPKRPRGCNISAAKQVLADNTYEFCVNTTLHGLKYVVDKNLHIIERAFFALSFIAVVIVSIFFISNVYAKWRSTPVILSLNPVPAVISKVPFPAVTICNLNQALRSKVKDFRNDTIEYAMLQTICHREVNMSIAKTMDWNMLEQFIVNISQPCASLLVSCEFGGIDYNCSEIFRPIVTDAGLCCVFNMLHPEFMYIPEINNILNISYSDGSTPLAWDPEHGYPDKLPPLFYPRTAAGTGEGLGFTVILDLDAKEYYCSSANGRGFKIFLHSPTETPHVKDVGLFLAAGTENKLRIRPEKQETDMNLRSMPKKYRQCIFASESNLVYFSYYTKRNCEMECLTRMTMQHCGCVSHYMPKMYMNGSICGIQHQKCVNHYRRTAMLSIENVDDCQDLCLPSCYDLTFDPDVFSIGISHKGFSVEREALENVTTEYAVENVAIAHMFYKENTYRSSKQSEFIGTTDFLSSVGGLIGLFVGFSFISLAEFIYYALLRPYYNIKHRSHRFMGVPTRRPGNIAQRRQQANKNLKQRFSQYFEKFSKRKGPRRNIKIFHVMPYDNENINGNPYYGLDINAWQMKHNKNHWM